MKLILVLVGCVLVGAEPPTAYTHRTSGHVLFQPVPSVAHLHLSQDPPSAASSRSSSYGAPPTGPAPQSSRTQHNQFTPQYPQNTHQSPPDYSSAQHTGSPSYNQPSYQSPPSYHANSHPVQVSYGGGPPDLPPGASYGPPPVVTGAGPDHDIEYRVVYVKTKAPKPDLVLPPPPPKMKTIVYILVPRVEAPEPIIVPTHPPTPPSKPEVYFIRYKAPKKNRVNSYPPSGQYGAPSEPKGVVADPASKKREVPSTHKSADQVASTFGDRVKLSTQEE